MTEVSDVGDASTWWEELTAAALVGTARRPVPPLPPELGVARAGAGREAALLDAAALGSVVRRVRPPLPVPATTAAAQADRRPVAPPRAVQLLELLLHQTPVGRRLTPALLDRWLATADAQAMRVPHHLLPELLDLATRDERFRAAVRGVADARGTWLATVNPTWAWLGAAPDQPGGDGPDEAAWARMPTDEREIALLRLRGTDPAAGRRLLESTWATDAAPARTTLLAALRRGLGPDDEPLLERVLDDRSAKVRETALALLDRLPGSARAARMAARLRPLLRVTGMLRKSLEIELPLEPDAAGVRDGLGRSRTGGSQRDHWLDAMIHAAPLAVWTDATGADPARTWRMLTDPRLRTTLTQVVLRRRDPAWAAALTPDVVDRRLLDLLPPEQVETVAIAQLARTRPAHVEDVETVLTHVPAPWGPAFSGTVVRRLSGEKRLSSTLTEALAQGLDPSVRPALEAWADTLDPDDRRSVTLITTYLTLVPEITEAFR